MRTLLVSTACLTSLAVSAVQPEFTAFPESGAAFNILNNGATYLTLNFMGWGRQWSHIGMRGSAVAQDGGTRAVCRGTVRDTDARITLESFFSLTNERRMRINIELGTSQDTDLMFMVAALGFGAKAFAGGHVTATHATGTNTTVALPLGRKGLGAQVTSFTATDAAGRTTTVTLAPARDISADGAARILLAQDRLTTSTPVQVAMTIELPAPVTYYASAADVPEEPGFDTWYAFTPSRSPGGTNEISLRDWIERPAGKHGRITRAGGELRYNGAPVKLWGLNLCFGACLPDKDTADARAVLYPAYGINTVRLHKYAESDYSRTASATEFNSDAIDRMDYQVAKFKEAGIYIDLSVHFGAALLGPADRTFVPYIDEIGSFDGQRGGRERIKAVHSALFYSPELQTVHIQQMLNLLAHTNPYTGMTYAEDPVVAFIECVNEQSILFHSSMLPLKSYPSVRAMTAKRFSAWLKKKYGSQKGLLEAWGAKALNSFGDEVPAAVDEDLDKGNILPLGNPWYWDPDNLNGSQAFRKRRLLDSLQFLYELQCACYDRYVKALRAAGYQGEIIGSNWQAGRAFSHYYNLHSDYLVGTIDRHNYFGGGDGKQINNATMLRVPGSGMLGSGMQQVLDRPFMLSEWIHVSPNEWRVEGPAIIGAYGMGLQGWDVSYMFQNRDDGGLARELNRDRWEVTVPQVIGVFPAVARQVLRADVETATTLAPRKVCVEALGNGELGFSDSVRQDYDVKSFDSVAVPSRALAVARCVIEFTKTQQPTPAFDITPYVSNGVYTSSTGQLRWHEGEAELDGFFTMDTPGTKAVVGFAAGRQCELGGVTITPECRYAAIYVTAREHDRTLADTTNVLVVAIARGRNSGMKVLDDRFILEPGSAPVMMEPVRATIHITRPGAAVVHVLDHNGRRTGTTLPIEDGAFEIDGARDRTPYYLVEYR